MTTQEDKQADRPLSYVFSDRALEDTPLSLDLYFPSSRDTIDLIDYWLQLREEQGQKQIESREWISLEMAYLSHLKWRFDYPRQVLKQQLLFSWIVTILVVILVIAGLAFSFLQLNYALTIGSVTELSTEIAVENAGSLSFRSSLVGASVLAISLLFYYLYLRYVFSMKQPKPPHIPLATTDALKLFGKDKPFKSRARKVSDKNT